MSELSDIQRQYDNLNLSLKFIFMGRVALGINDETTKCLGQACDMIIKAIPVFDQLRQLTGYDGFFQESAKMATEKSQASIAIQSEWMR